jgi:hypothetical protein
MTSYSVQVFDAQLQRTLTHSGVFFPHPFADDPAQPQRAVPRTALYTSFLVAPTGEIYTSQMPRREDDSQWP